MELLLAFALLGILGIFAASIIAEQMQRQALLKSVQLAGDLLAEAKNQSLLWHQTVTVELDHDHIRLNDKRYPYFGSVLLQNPETISYNERGNVNHAATLLFYTKNDQLTLTIWLGGGMFEIGKLRHDSD